MLLFLSHWFSHASTRERVALTEVWQTTGHLSVLGEPFLWLHQAPLKHVFFPGLHHVEPHECNCTAMHVMRSPARLGHRPGFGTVVYQKASRRPQMPHVSYGYGSKLNHQGTAGFVHVSTYQGSILGTLSCGKALSLTGRSKGWGRQASPSDQGFHFASDEIV